MRRILKTLLATFGVGLLDAYRRLGLDLLKIRAALIYVQGVQTVRQWWIGTLLIFGLLLLLAAGFIMVHVGFFLWVPWPPAVKALVLLVLGLIYMAAALAAICKLCSEKTWLEASRANELIAEVTRKS
jgi:hypothetical protein